MEERHQALTKCINDLMSKYVPQKRSSSHRNVPWMNRSLKQLCKRKQRLYNNARKKRTLESWERFKAHQRLTTTSLRKARQEYINNILTESLEKNDSKPFWRYIKAQRQENCGIAPLKDKGQLHPDACKKAEILNKQFTSVFTSDKQDMHASTVIEGPSIPSISDITVSSTGVAKMLNNLNVKKACGPDYLACRLLKELAEELAPIYADIFQCSLDTGELPSVWKTANVVPIYKKGPVSEAANYRPVSLTCIPCKMLEHILCTHIRSHLQRFGALTPLNHGFRAKHSCDTQLVLTIQDLLEKADQAHSRIDVAVLDFSKAFDKVPHARLMSKLRLLGIDGKVSSWIEAFLTNRTQKVCVDGHLSGSSDVLSGVPQGTILGPLLFLCFINDLPAVVDPNTQIRLFADDCLAYRTISCSEDQCAFQRDLNSLTTWGHQWGMHFNVSKCNIMCISSQAEPCVSFYEMNGKILEQVDTAKYLGISLQATLEFARHIEETVSKANKKLGFLKRNLKDCPASMRKMAYTSLVRSGLEYGSVVWDPHLATHRKSLEQVQNRAIRWIMGIRPRQRCSVTSLRKELDMLTLEDRRLHHRLVLFHKVVNGEVAITPDDLGLQRADSRTRAAHRHKFREKGARTNRLKLSTVHRTIPAWNSLPALVAEAGSTDIFKSRLSASHP